MYILFKTVVSETYIHAYMHMHIKSKEQCPKEESTLGCYVSITCTDQMQYEKGA